MSNTSPTTAAATTTHTGAMTMSDKTAQPQEIHDGEVSERTTPTLEGSSKTPPTPQLSTGQAILLIVTVTLAMMQNSANSTTASIALPRIGEALHIPESDLQWIISAYALSSGCLLIFFGRLADLHGRKRAFLLGTIFSTVFGLGCGFANDALTINILRGLQGVGVAATIPASLGILAHAFPPSRMRSIAFSAFSAGAPVGAAFGMTIGGVLTQVTKPGWKSTFYFSSAMGVICLIGGVLSIPADPPFRLAAAQKLSASETADRRVDWLGAFLVTAGLVFIVFVLSDGETAPNGWKTGYIIALLIVGVLFIAAFLYWQTVLDKHHNSNNSALADSLPTTTDGSIKTSSKPVPWWSAPPLIRPSLWTRAHGKLGAMLAVAFLTWCCFLAWQFWAQLYYQQYLGLSPVLTMVRLLPMFVTGIVANVIVALCVGRVDVVVLTLIGTLCTALATLFFALTPSGQHVSYWALGFPSAILSVVGADFVFACGTLFVARVAAPEEQSLAGALFLTMTQLGTSFGLTISTIVYNRVSKGARAGSESGAGEGAHGANDAAALKGFQAAQWSALGFGLAAALITVLFLRGVGIVGHTKGDQAAAKATEADAEKSNDLGRRRSTSSSVAPAVSASHA